MTFDSALLYVVLPEICQALDICKTADTFPPLPLAIAQLNP